MVGGRDLPNCGNHQLFLSGAWLSRWRRHGWPDHRQRRSSSSSSSSSCSVPPAPSIGDYNGDGRLDVFWRNGSVGSNTIWRSANSATLHAVHRRHQSCMEGCRHRRFRCQWASRCPVAQFAAMAANSSGDRRTAPLRKPSRPSPILPGMLQVSAISTTAAGPTFSGATTVTGSQCDLASGLGAHSPNCCRPRANLAWKIVGVGDFNGDQGTTSSGATPPPARTPSGFRPIRHDHGNPEQRVRPGMERGRRGRFQRRWKGGHPLA